MAYGFFAGNFTNTLDTAAYKNAGHSAFGFFSSAEGEEEYQAMSNIHLLLDTPNVTNIPNSSQSNKEANGQKTMCGLVRNGGTLASSIHTVVSNASGVVDISDGTSISQTDSD